MKIFKLRELLKIRNGKDHKELQSGDIPVFGSGGLMRYGNKFLYDRESILLPRKGTLSNIQWINEPFWTVDTIYYTELNDHIVDGYFLYSYLSNLDLSKLNSGTGVPSMTFDAYYEIEVKLPDLKTQKLVSGVLKTIKAKISLNNRINAELEAMAKTIYDYWFVQFDFPFDFAQGKPLKNGRRNEPAELKPYKSSGGKMVWNEELKREIPEGWEVDELRSYLKAKRGISYSGANLLGSGISMINLNSFNPNSTYKPNGIKTFSGKCDLSKVLKPYDLVMCNTQQTALDPTKDIIGKSFLVPDVFLEGAVSSHHVTTITVDGEDLKFYLNSLFSTDYFHRYISGFATGTNILGLNFEGVLAYRTAIPSREILSKFKAVSLNLEKHRSKVIKENQQLASLRDWLLPMLMNGQVTVKD